MACYFVGFNIAGKKEEKKALFAEGRDAGLYALQHTTVSAEAYFWTAVNMALYGEAVGVVKMLFTLPTVRRYLQASAALDPSYAYGGANRILGKIDESLPALLGGSRERAAALYRKAIAAAPDEPLNYLFLARLLAAAGRSSDEALAIARQGAALSVNETFRFESIQGLRELRQFAARFDQDIKKEGEK
jgi:hypothetical protein